MRPNPNRRVRDWMDSLRRKELGITAISVAEIAYGTGPLPEGNQKRMLLDAAAAVFDELFFRHVFAFDRLAAVEYADIVIKRDRMGFPISMPDAQISSICRVLGADFATRNTKDFKDIGLRLIDPWEM